MLFLLCRAITPREPLPCYADIILRRFFFACFSPLLRATPDSQRYVDADAAMLLTIRASALLRHDAYGHAVIFAMLLPLIAAAAASFHAAALRGH